MKRTINYYIDAANANQSIEKFLKSKSYTSSVLAKIKKMPESVVIKGKWVHMNRILNEGETLSIIISENENSENILPVKLDFQAVYEDEDIIVVNKPANMPIHPSLNNYENSLANALAYYYKAQNKNFVFRCINRLDKDTTGLTIVAKNMISACILYKDMQKRRIKRTYLALVENNKSLPDTGIIDAPIARQSESLITRIVDFEKGDKALTRYKVLSTHKNTALVELKLDTGRTHQIRVHMSYIFAPLVGDYLYNPKYLNSTLTRPLLHSSRLEFNHPINAKPLSFLASLPPDMNIESI